MAMIMQPADRYTSNHLSQQEIDFIRESVANETYGDLEQARGIRFHGGTNERLRTSQEDIDLGLRRAITGLDFMSMQDRKNFFENMRKQIATTSVQPVAQNGQVSNQNNQVIRLPDATVYPEQFTSPDSNWEPGMGSDYTGTFNGNYITNVPDSPAPNVAPPPTRLDALMQQREELKQTAQNNKYNFEAEYARKIMGNEMIGKSSMQDLAQGLMPLVDKISKKRFTDETPQTQASKPTYNAMENASGTSSVPVNAQYTGASTGVLGSSGPASAGHNPYFGVQQDPTGQTSTTNADRAIVNGAGAGSQLVPEEIAQRQQQGFNGRLPMPDMPQMQNNVSTIDNNVAANQSGSLANVGTSALLDRGNAEEFTKQVQIQEQKEPGFIRKMMADPNFFPQLAMSFNTLRLRPDAGLNTAMMQQIETNNANKIVNRTADYFANLGTPAGDRAASLIMSGFDPKEAIALYKSESSENRSADYFSSLGTDEGKEASDLIRAGFDPKEAMKIHREGDIANKTAIYFDTRDPELAKMIRDGSLSGKDALAYYQSLNDEGLTDAMKTRIQAAKELGLKPGSPEYNAQISGNNFSDVAKNSREAQSELRKEWVALQETKDFQSISRSLDTLISASEKPSGPADLAMIFSFMKMLDPGSVVRESEYRTAADARSTLTRVESSLNEKGIFIPSAIVQMIEKMKSGATLLPEQRAQMVEIAKDQYLSGQERMLESAGEYQRLGVDTYGIAEDVASKMLPIPKSKKFGKQKTPEAGSFQGSGQDRYKFLGGDPTLESSWERSPLVVN